MATGIEQPTGDIALVSGATGGMGSAIVERLAQDGATVVMLGRSLDRLSAAKERLATRISGDARLVPLEMDVNSLDSVERGVAAVLSEFGRIDVLVNAAGDGPVASLLETTDELWMGTVNSKLLGTVRLTRAVGRSMVDHRSGHIVIINGAFRREPDPHFPINGTVNAGLGAFAKAVSRDLGRSGVRVNVVDPGATDTGLWHQTVQELAERLGTTAAAVDKHVLDKTPLGTLTTPADIAETVAFLASGASRNINGASITIDGGASVAV